MKAAIITGGKHVDERGELFFFNDLDLGPIKRFYTITHPETKVVRAWQGHKIETKWFHVIEGEFTVVLVKPDDWIKPSPLTETEKFSLKAGENIILKIPGGYANGVKAVIPGSKLLIFSDRTVDEAKDDNYRFDKDLWYNWNE